MSDKPIRCALCDLRSSGLFGALEGELLDRVDRVKTIHTYKPRQVVFHEGTPPLAIHCIRSGRIKLYKMGSRSEEQVVRILGPGDTFGSRAILADEPYSVSAEVLEESEICTVPRQAILDLLAQSPPLGFELMRRLAHDLRVSEDMLIDLTQRSVKERTAQLLIMMMEGCGESTPQGIRVHTPIHRKEMAQMVGTTPETFSRTLSTMARDGIISLSRTEITITHPDALRRITEESSGAD